MTTAAPANPPLSLADAPSSPLQGAVKDSCPAASQTPGRRILLTEEQLRAILDAARTTGNSAVFEALSKGLPRSCRVMPYAPLYCIGAAPDPTLSQRVVELQARAVALAKETFLAREEAQSHFGQSFSHTLNTWSAPHARTPSPPRTVSHSSFVTTGNDNQTSAQTILANLYPRVTESTRRINAIASSIHKVRTHASDTKRRVNNVRAVLARLGDDVHQTNDDPGELSQTIHADWTLMVNDVTSFREIAPASPQIFSPIPTQAQAENNGDDDGMLSPFVTPRSKARKRAACSFARFGQPIRLQLPR